VLCNVVFDTREESNCLKKVTIKIQLKTYSDVLNYTNRLVVTDNCFLNSALSRVKIRNKKIVRTLNELKITDCEIQGLVFLTVISVLEESVSSPSKIVEINSVVYIVTFT